MSSLQLIALCELGIMVAASMWAILSPRFKDNLLQRAGFGGVVVYGVLRILIESERESVDWGDIGLYTSMLLIGGGTLLKVLYWKKHDRRQIQV